VSQTLPNWVRSVFRHALQTWVRSVLGPKCLGSEVSGKPVQKHRHLIFYFATNANTVYMDGNLKVVKNISTAPAELRR